MKINLQKILKEQTDNIFIQIFRYLLSGGIAFIVDFFLLYVLKDKFGMYYLHASIISFCVGLIITYLLSIFWIFDQRRLNNRASEFLVFAIIGAIALLLTSLFMWFFTDIIHTHYLISKIFTTIIVSAWNFIIKKITLFTKNKKA